MNKKILPAVGIIVVTIILVTMNEFTELTFIKLPRSKLTENWNLLFAIEIQILHVQIKS